MIIQRGAANGRFFVITMDQHTALSGAFAASFGNARFAPVAPRELLLYVIAHHDKGWVDLDAAPGTDPATGLPYNLVETPMADIVPTSIASPDFNERHHPYCGLISSMHSWGLYNGRYGLSDSVDGGCGGHNSPACAVTILMFIGTLCCNPLCPHTCESNLYTPES